MQAAMKIWILAASLILHVLVVINETAASRRKHDMFGVFFSHQNAAKKRIQTRHSPFSGPPQ
jgi:hypothetical protein